MALQVPRPGISWTLIPQRAVLLVRAPFSLGKYIQIQR